MRLVERLSCLDLRIYYISFRKYIMNLISLVILAVVICMAVAAIILYETKIKKKSPCAGCTGDCKNCIHHLRE